MTPVEPPKSAGDMMADILGTVSSLVRNEVDLARAEMAASLNRAAVAIATLVFSVILAITGFNVLAAAAVALAIRLGLSPAWAATAVGVALLLLACVIFLSAKSTLNTIGFMPTRAARSVGRDAAAIKEAYND